ncbi:MAG TPA: helix-turn-helix transcriptional regulator [Acidimicrobiia bacterium]|jgi:transcriptional regulator with XRE-family HTH domain
MTGAQMVREARRRAGLSQHELAKRAGVHQPAIARWESGRTDPSLSTVERLVSACGLELRFSLISGDTAEPSLANLALSPEERLDQLVRTVRFIEEGRRQMSRSRG